MAEQDKNPKHAAGLAKPPVHNIPVSALLELGKVMALGAAKYGDHNFSEAGVAHSIYYDARWRHDQAYHTGELRDFESHCLHLAHIMACCAIEIECIYKGNLLDDRPKHAAPVCHTIPPLMIVDAEKLDPKDLRHLEPGKIVRVKDVSVTIYYPQGHDPVSNPTCPWSPPECPVCTCAGHNG